MRHAKIQKSSQLRHGKMEIDPFLSKMPSELRPKTDGRARVLVPADNAAEAPGDVISEASAAEPR